MNLSNEILNGGLNLSMDFGPNWLADIDHRLTDEYPELTKAELKTCDELCREINKKAHDYVSNNPVRKDNKLTFIEFSEFKKFMLEEYAWINDENLSKIYSQSCYYAVK